MWLFTRGYPLTSLFFLIKPPTNHQWKIPLNTIKPTAYYWVYHNSAWTELQSEKSFRPALPSRPVFEQVWCIWSGAGFLGTNVPSCHMNNMVLSKHRVPHSIDFRLHLKSYDLGLFENEVARNPQVHHIFPMEIDITWGKKGNVLNHLGSTPPTLGFGLKVPKVSRANVNFRDANKSWTTHSCISGVDLLVDSLLSSGILHQLWPVVFFAMARHGLPTKLRKNWWKLKPSIFGRPII